MTRALTKAVATAVFLAAAALFSTTSTLALAQNEKPDATVSFSGGSAAVGVGVTWGQGTLHFQGKDYPFRLQGLGLVDIGGSSIQATGEVYNLKKVEDFNGNYAAASAAAALGGGESETAMRNEHGVVMRLHSTTKGAQLKASLEGVSIQLGAAGQ